MTREEVRRGTAFGGAVVGAWLLVAIVAAGPWYLYRALAGRPTSPAELTQTLASSVVWMAFTPLVWWLARRFPIERARWRPRLAAHLAFAVAFAALDVAADIALQPWAGRLPAAPLYGHFLAQAFVNLSSYAAVVAVAHGVAYHRLSLERGVTAAQLETKLVAAQLQTLEMQLRPHFLFNTLHAVAALVRSREDRAAVRMLAGLSELLRETLRPEGAQEVSLREELAFIERYLEIERIRFQDRLQVRVEPDSTTLDALVPRLVLQPLVENAIRHGIESRSGAGSVCIEAGRVNGDLRIRVTDASDSARLPRTAEGEGVGLANTRARLTHLYGSRHRLTLTATPGGAVVELAVPFRVNPEARHA